MFKLRAVHFYFTYCSANNAKPRKESVIFLGALSCYIKEGRKGRRQSRAEGVGGGKNQDVKRGRATAGPMIDKDVLGAS